MKTAPMTRIVAPAALAISLAFLCTSCWTYSTAQNKVTLGSGIYVWFKQIPTNQVIALNDGVHHGDTGRTLAAMKGWSKSQSFVRQLERTCYAGRCASEIFLGFFHSSEKEDFAGALGKVRGPTNRACLLGHWNPVSRNPHNWTAGHNRSDCTVGEGYHA